MHIVSELMMEFVIPGLRDSRKRNRVLVEGLETNSK